jgi:hypothetical protein
VTGVTGGGAPFSLATTTTVSRHTELNVRSPGFNPPKSFLHRSDMPAFTKTISSLSKAELLSAAATFHFDATGSVDDLRTRLKAHMAALLSWKIRTMHPFSLAGNAPNGLGALRARTLLLGMALAEVHRANPDPCRVRSAVHLWPRLSRPRFKTPPPTR